MYSVLEATSMLDISYLGIQEKALHRARVRQGHTRVVD